MKKLFLFLLAAPKGMIDGSMLSVCQQPLTTLPPDCDNFEIIKGDPLTAKTIIFGETHKICESAKVSCTQSLLAAKCHQETTLLLESLGHDQKTLCEERGYDKLSDDCRGWNLPKKQNDVFQTLYLKQHVMSGIFEEFKKKTEELRSKPENIQRLEAVIFIKTYVEFNKQHLEDSEKKYAEVARKYPGFYSSKLLTLRQNKFRQKELEKISKKIIDDKLSMHEIMLYIINFTNQCIVHYNAHLSDPVASIEKPNDAMIEAIQTASKKNKNIVVYAGDSHINLFHTRILKFTDQNKRIIQNLYNKLDEFATENPYAILSCKL